MSKHTNIDGFFMSRREQLEPGRRPGLDGVKPVRRTQPAVTDGAPRLQRRTSMPLNATADDFLHTTVGSVDAGKKTAIPPLPLDDEPEGQSKKRRWPRFTKPSRRTVKRTLIGFAILLVLIGGFFLVRFILAGGQIFKGNVFNAIFADGKPLETDENGRSNIVVFGTSEDDPGHEGAELSDSILVISIDQKKNDAFMVSLPRDFYVDYGMACISGYEGKVNEVYMCGKANGNDSEDAGQEALRNKVGDIFGLDIQYSAHVNYQAMRSIVDAVGGITVKIESDDPRGILDRNFDWKCNYQCHYVKWPNGDAQLDGEQALALARARGSIAPTYGLSGGNFDREQYQRKILVAIKDKAVSAGTLANPVAVNGLIDALGENVRTNFEAAEVKTLARLGQDITNDKIRSLSLVEEENQLVTTGDIAGMSIVQPAAGLTDYSQIQAAVRAYATGDTAYLEAATVDVLNASGQPGVAQTKADELIEDGITVEVVGNAPETLGSASVQLYDLSGGDKPATLRKLETILGTKAISDPPAGVTSVSDFVIIIGSNGAS